MLWWFCGDQIQLNRVKALRSGPCRWTEIMKKIGILLSILDNNDDWILSGITLDKGNTTPYVRSCCLRVLNTLLLHPVVPYTPLKANPVCHTHLLFQADLQAATGQRALFTIPHVVPNIVTINRVFLCIRIHTTTSFIHSYMRPWQSIHPK